MNKKYSDKLKDPRWQKKRLEILQRDNWACGKCGDTKSTLHVHHEYYKKGVEPWDYDGKALITICENCHSKEHSEDIGEILFPEKTTSPLEIKIKRNQEWHLFSIIICYNSISKTILMKIYFDWIMDGFLREIMGEMLRFSNETKEFNLNNFYQKFPDYKKIILETLSFKYDIELPVIEKQAEIIVIELERCYLIGQLKKIDFNIRNRSIDRVIGLKKKIFLTDRIRTINQKNQRLMNV